MSLDATLARIAALKKSRSATIIAHHYAPAEVHPVADVLADSRGFFEAISGPINAQVVVVVAPVFFAEIAATLLPDKTVLVPVKAECPVAHHRHLGFAAVREFKEQNPGVPLLCYATSPLETKLLADFVALPGEVVQTVQRIEAPEVLFVGEKNCADEAVRKCGKKLRVFPNNPVCNVYNVATRADVERLKAAHPGSLVLVHPECKPEVTEIADHAIGTGEMLRLIEADPKTRSYILGTELGFVERARREHPQKTFAHLTPYLACNVFKVLRIETVLEALETGRHPVVVDGAYGKIAPLLRDMLAAGRRYDH